MSDHPKVFISYAWTDEAHSNRVLSLASRLVEDGVDIKIDKWDLKVGNDAHVFMESMVSDKEIRKVIIISNRIYAERANDRVGGAGVEAQIITPEIYKSSVQDKFALIAFELDEDGKPFVPTFYGSRIYINLAEGVGYEEEYEHLLRWVYEKPLHKRPKRGNPPDHILSDDKRIVRTKSTYSRALDAIKHERVIAAGTLRAFRDALSGELTERRLVSEGRDDFGEAVILSIEELRPLVDEIQSIATEMSRAPQSSELQNEFALILEQMMVHSERAPDVGPFHEWDLDNLKFIAHEVFLTSIAIFIREGRYDIAEYLFKYRYVNPRSRSMKSFTLDFSRFQYFLRSLRHRNDRKDLRKISPEADFMNMRYSSASISVEELIQADIVCYIRDAALARTMEGHSVSWYPSMLLYSNRDERPLDIFARCESAAFADRVARLVGASNVLDMKALVQGLATTGWGREMGYFPPSITVLTNLDRIAIYP